MGHLSSNCHSPFSALSATTVVSGNLDAFSPRKVHQTSTFAAPESSRHVKVTAEQLLTTGGSTICSRIDKHAEKKKIQSALSLNGGDKLKFTLVQNVTITQKLRIQKFQYYIFTTLFFKIYKSS